MSHIALNVVLFISCYSLIGQRECVNIINGYFPIERLKHYTQPQGESGCGLVGVANIF